MKKTAATFGAMLVAGAIAALPQTASAVVIDFSSYQASMTAQVTPPSLGWRSL